MTHLKNIKLIVLDVDGTLSDGKVYLGTNGSEFKAFSIKDGLVLAALSKVGIEAIILTGRKSEAVDIRAKELGIIAIQGISDKKTELDSLLVTKGLTYENVAYIGDDLNDFSTMSQAAFKGAPVDAVSEIKAIVDYVSRSKAGDGAVREIIEHLLKQTGHWKDILSLYGV